ncbi:MAG: hypothetical protein AAGD11_13615 [Planctomycetota bacterium]
MSITRRQSSSRASRLLVAIAICLHAAESLRAQQLPSPELNTTASSTLIAELEQALDSLSRAELARELADMDGRRPKSLDKARQQCRSALKALQKLDRRISKLLVETYEIRPSQRKNRLTIKELESLDRNLNVQIARGYRNQALCYDEQSVDRINSLSLAIGQLSEVARQPLDDPSTWQARIEHLVCLRLTNKLEQAESHLDDWLARSPPPSVASRFRGERILIALAGRDLQRALALVHTADRAATDSVTAPETDDAVLLALLQAQTLATPDASVGLLARAQAQVQRIADEHGPYWKRRAQARLGRAMQSHLDSDEPILLGYAAAHLAATGQTKEAIAVYDRMATLFALKDQLDQQFDTQRNAAALVRSLPDADAACRRFRQLAVQHPMHQSAAKMHLIAIGLASDLVRSSEAKERPLAFEHYRTLLEEYLRLWPDAPSAEDVRGWLDNTRQPAIAKSRAQTKARMGERDESIKLYRGLVAESPNDAQVLEELAKALGFATDKSELREAQQLWKRIETRSKPGSKRWWRGRRARIKLFEQLGEREKAEKLKQLTEILYE